MFYALMPYLVGGVAVICILLESFLSMSAKVKVTLPQVISDHMVFQRNCPIQVWGQAGPFETVKVRLGSCSTQVSADLLGRWVAKLPPMPPGGPYELDIEGANVINVHDVLIGDVWLCSGQSNMSMTMACCESDPSDVRSGCSKLLRHFIRTKPELESSAAPAVWQVAESENIPNFSAVAYWLSKELVRSNKIPIGIIECPVGGSPIKCWISQATLHKKGKMMLDWEYGGLFNALIQPLSKYSLSGFIWYQGEADIFGAKEYPKLLCSMVKDWRNAFHRSNLPFFYVQLPNFGKKCTNPSDSLWAELREAQQRCAFVPNTFMTVNVDTAYSGANGADLHPTTKKVVGERLAACILATQYGKPVSWKAPTVRDVVFTNDTARVSFEGCGICLHSVSKNIHGFAVAGPDGHFYWADANLLPNGCEILLRSKRVQKPVAVRYAWADNPEVSLFNGSGVPAAPFRTDNWRPPEFCGKTKQ